MTGYKAKHEALAESVPGSKTVFTTGAASIWLGSIGIPSEKVHKSQDRSKTKVDLRKPHPSFVRGIGLTRRLFDYLMNASPAPVEAVASTYLLSVSRHVESVVPSKNVFAQMYCPVIVEDKTGSRHVLHIDPVVLRTFRRMVAEELRHVREKRSRMTSRIEVIRQHFPQPEASEIAARLTREIDDARCHLAEPLLQELPASTDILHVFIEMTPFMLQLELVCRQLVHELPGRLSAVGATRVSFSLLASSGVEGSEMLPAVAFSVHDREAWDEARDWLLGLRSPASSSVSRSGKSSRGFSFAQALWWATTSDAFEPGMNSTVLLLACSKPVDFEACIGSARRSSVPLQVIGVFGLAPEDPEPSMQQLVSAVGSGSTFRTFFGSAYWEQFISMRETQLHALTDHAGDEIIAKEGSDREVVSADVFEMRLIERVLRECYSEEQQCEEELTCATRVFERTLLDREDLLSCLRNKKTTSSMPRPKALMPNSAR